MREIETRDLGEAWVERAWPALLEEFPSVRLRVTGVCMEPQLRAAAPVELVSTAVVQPRWGDVVLVRQGDGLRLHRLIWAPPGRRARWRTKADRGPRWDAPVSRADVLATVVAAGDRWRALRSLCGAVAMRIRDLPSSSR